MDFTRWPNFAPHEVLSPDGMALYERGIFVLRTSALDFLQMFRNHIDVRLVVNNSANLHRGWRSPQENLEIYDGDNRFSFHTAGVAFDVSSPDLTPLELMRRAKSFGWVGIGLYATFLHLDQRDGEHAFWNNSGRPVTFPG